MVKNWWKILAVLLLVYTIVAGFLFAVPRLPILHETIRNLYFHVTMWFSMMILFTVGVVNSIRYLASNNKKFDLYAQESVHVGVILGVLGLLTGMVWANYTWGKPWTNDPQLNGAAVTMLAYFAYLVLRNSFDDDEKKARVSAVYNIFAFVLMFVFIGILPRMNDSLHPGKGGNPGFGKYDLDNSMRLVFYPAVIAWTLLGVWIMQIRVRIQKLKYQSESYE